MKPLLSLAELELLTVTELEELNNIEKDSDFIQALSDITVKMYRESVEFELFKKVK